MINHKKLIEVALPLEAINKASAREKSIRHGHPSTLHLWWARRPLAAARAVIFAQMVDDPSAHPDQFPTEEAQEQERQRLFRLIEELVLWENTTNEAVLTQAREEIWKSWRATCAANKDHPRAAELFNPEKLSAFHDSFAGGGSLPLEAQRLGLQSYASDLNPVAVLICKAMIEMPPKFAGQPPVNPEAHREKTLLEKEWQGAQGLAEDVRYYGKWMRDEAEKRIGHLYPKIEITADMARERPDLKSLIGRKLTVIAWLWARTVKSPNPAFAHVDVPLVSTFMLSTKVGKEAYVEPMLLGARASSLHADETSALPGYRFTVKVGKPGDAEAAKHGTKLARGANFQCVMSGTPISGDYIKAEGRAGRMGARLMAIVAEGERGQVYLPPTPEHEAIARRAQPEWKPESALPDDPRNFWTVQYGLTIYGDLFTPRQLVALKTFSDLVQEAMARVKRDCLGARASGPQGTDETSVLPGVASTGWETFLDAVIRAGFAISGTWPIRTELGDRMIGKDTNALASSIVLVCRPRATNAPTATRREFVTALKAELPDALLHLQRGNIAPVDLAQAAIGPGMAVYTRYARVLDAEGKPLSVREALALINQILDEVLAEQEGDFDADSRWALAWFEQSGFAEGEFGVAETLSKAKNTSVAGMVEAGILVSKGGKVRLLRPEELPTDWDPATDPRLTAWEVVHQLIRVLEAGGESAAAALVAKLGSHAETARELAYRLYTLCERKKRAQEALSYNGLVQSWPEIVRLARETPQATPVQTDLL